MKWNRTVWAQSLVLIPWVVFAFSWNIWGFPLFDLDEGAFSAATSEMLHRGDYLTTYLNGELRFDKPILIYWLQAASVSLLGVNEMAFRLPSSIAAVLWAFAVYRFAKRYMDGQVANIAIWMMSAAFMMIIMSHAATADAVLNLLITLTLFNIYHYFSTGETRYIYLTYLWMGLGVLCKGPIAVLIPLVVSILFALWDQRWRSLWSAIFYPKAWLLFFAIALPWYVLEYIEQGQKFIDGFFLKHNVGRFTATMHNHAGYVWYYIPVILLVIMPFGGWLLQMLLHVRRVVSDSLGRFLLIWFAFVFLFFSFSQSQLPHYMLYGTVPILLLMARNYRLVTWRWLAFLPVLLLSLLVLALPLLLQYVQQSKPDDAMVQALYLHGQSFFDMQYWALSVLFVIAVFAGFFYRQWPVYQRLLAVGVVQTIVLLFALIPAVSWMQQEPVKQAAQFLNKLETQPRVIMQTINMPSITTYRQVVTPRGDAQVGEWAFTRINRLDNPENYEIHFSQGGIVLAERIR